MSLNRKSLRVIVLAAAMVLGISNCKNEEPLSSENNNYKCSSSEIFGNSKKTVSLYKGGKLAAIKIKINGEIQYWIPKKLGGPTCWRLDNKGKPVLGSNSKDINEHLERIDQLYKLIKNCE